MEILSLASTFFIVANPLGNSPAIIALIRGFDLQKQKMMMFRESMFALAIAIFFQYFGQLFLETIVVKPYSLKYSGGILLFLVALSMIFPKTDEGMKEGNKEPYFVPIATPLIAGPGLMTTIMVKSQEVNNSWLITAALLFTWIFVTAVLLAAPYMLKILKKRGLIALEQLMGMILMMIAVEMIVSATAIYLKSGAFAS